MKNLVIVESPAKGKTIEKYLGKDYKVIASLGHIVELRKGGNAGIGIDIEKNFKPKYTLIKEKLDTINNIINEAKKADNIYIASDPDREGEAIAYHIKQRLESIDKPIKRIEFNQITKSAVQDAIKKARDIDMNMFFSQESRRILDRLIGFMVSPFLMRTFNSTLSAGRVQSVTVRMIIDRDKEISSFKPEEFWNCFVNFTFDSKNFSAKLEEKIKNSEEADKIKNYLSSVDFVVDKVIRKEKKEKPQPPLITSKLQQVLAKAHGFDAERTMKAAQVLYESGYITYMRTDSTRTSDEALKSVRDYVKSKYDLPKSPNTFESKDSAQDAHECIRPTNPETSPDDLLSQGDEKLVYEQIWKYFVASQMNPAIYDTLEIKIKDQNGNYSFKTSGKALKYKGYLEVFGDVKESEINLPNLKEKDILKINKDSVKTEKKFTQPPPRYNVATLIEELEKKQIGRPSTYATIQSTILNRNYIEKNGNTYYATELGNKITDALKNHFTFMDFNYSAKLEELLDRIAEGSTTRDKVLKEFFSDFKEQLNKAYKEFGFHICSKCDNPMVARTNKKDNSQFLGCSNYPNCNNVEKIT